MQRISLPGKKSIPRTRLWADRQRAARIRRAEKELRRVPREDVSPAGIWIEDHARFLIGQADELREEAKHRPVLPGKRNAPRILAMARALCRERQGEITAPLLMRAVRDAFSEETLTEAELDGLPQALKTALMERILEVCDGCIQEAQQYTRALAWARSMIRGKQRQLPETETVLVRGMEILSRQEEEDALRRVRDMLFRAEKSLEDLGEQDRQFRTARGVLAGRLILSLRQVDKLPFDALRERLSAVSAILRQEETYRRMDLTSRAYYRQCVSRIARRLRADEPAVARAALTLAEGKTGPEGQAGYYLIHRSDLIGQSLRSKRAPAWTVKHRQGLFLMPMYGGAVLTLALCMVLGAPWYLWLAVPLCVSEIIRLGEYALTRRLFPARRLPRLHIGRLTPKTRTLVAVPTLLTSRKQALHMARQLAVLRCATPDPYVDFLLLGDFSDSKTEHAPEDDEILLAARESIQALNRQHPGRFFYLHRARRWDAGQRCFTGRERKRGALESLNRLLTEGKTGDRFAYASCDGKALRGRYAYVITLDADTFLPPDAVYQLVGAMEHPLQKGQVGVIQPRMETAADTVRTRTQRWLGGRGGVDPYGMAAQDAYQDIFGRGSFVGKGIYAPEVWLERLRGRLPAGRLLSHDLIEGEIVTSALAEDIVLYDGHPAALAGWQKRLHRWTRGDWQLLSFLTDRRLDALSRHKIWDNLRRSLVPAAQTAVLLAGAVLGMPALVLLALPWPIRGMGRRLLLLPARAFTGLDAAIRAIYRQFVSHRQLLSWVTAAQAEGGKKPPLSCVLAQIAAGTGLVFCSLMPGGFLPGALVGMGWAASPLLASWMDAPLKNAQPMTAAMQENVRALGRATWRFFEETVGEDTRYLPPDNVQLDPPKGPAMRTSPTNIGLYLLSCCAARELGYISTGQMIRRIGDTVNTLESLAVWKGHFYNWYDLTNGAPLPPAFVSTVDSGNLAACLMACAQLLRQRLADVREERRDLPARLDALAARMDFGALYDPASHLFFVGWDVSAGRPTAAHYDLLASEARLTSYLAVMTGQVERKHWAHLNRACVYAGGGPALLSWGGTMFEYLMPHLLLPLIPETLLGKGCRSAVQAQMSADPRWPFGISESGYYAFDPDMNYQYRAFGLPLLSLSGDTGGRVIAPYASLLALPFFPRAAAENLRRMQHLGWQGTWGLYEAVDHSPQRVEGGARIIKSHMAHHQGMILCAVCNALQDQALIRAFMTPPAARASAYLLQEKAPTAVHRRPDLPPPRKEDPLPGPSLRAAKAGFPLDAHVLAGGGVSWVMTARGQGYLAAKETMITRFDPEAGSQTGPQFYLRDEATGRMMRPAVQGKAVFGLGSVRYAADWEGLRTALHCCVDPLSGVAVACVQVENPGNTNRAVEAVSFLEIAQGSQASDEAHPNFRDLSVRVDNWGSHGLLSRRLPRSGKEKTPLIGHGVAGDGLGLRRQGDRNLFLGRQGTYAQPEQLARDAREIVCRVGDVLAPCLSLRVRLRLPAGGKGILYFFTAVRESMESLNAVVPSPAQAQLSFALADTQARMVLRPLRMDGRALGLYQQMLGALLFYGQPHQMIFPSAAPHALWRWGISGTLPVLLVNLREGMDPVLIRHALRCHAWLRTQGISMDLVLFCPEEGEYHRPRHDQAARLISAGPDQAQQGAPGGVHLVAGGEEQEKEMESLARLTLRPGQTLSAQLARIRTAVAAGKRRWALPEPVVPSVLSRDDGFGCFTEDGSYCVYAPAPAPWHNLLCSSAFGTLVCETGILYSYAGNSRLGRLTRWNRDVHRGAGSEEICLEDGEGRMYPLARCAAVHEPGVTVYTHRAGGVLAELTVFTQEDMPLGVRMLTLKSEEEKTVMLHWLVRFALGEHPEPTRCRAAGDWAMAESGGFPGVAWAAWQGASCRTVCPALWNDAEESAGSAPLFSRPVVLRPREPVRLTLALGHAEDEASAREQYARLLAQGAAAALRAVRAAWNERLSRLTLYAGDRSLERMMNRWLPYQVRTARLMARMGPYQPGGAVGFRDQLQDVLALLYTEPERARAHILLCAAHQFLEGDVQHWWHEPRQGVRTRITDDKLFLPYLVSRYVTVTGDAGILQEQVPYLQSAPLDEAEEDRYESPEDTGGQEPLLQHCLRALDSVRLGAHGLPLMGGGDWNDGMNRVGGRRGESVWLGFFLALVLRAFAPLCPGEVKAAYDARRRELMDHAESAWTGQWYLRAWYDDGKALGGPDTDPPRIDLISQCFAALAGAPRDHVRKALSHAVERLYDREAGLVKLLDPPFTPQEQAGYIGAYVPGVRENGGQYTHAVPWLILALCRVGEYGLAWEIARAILPENHSDTREKALVYRTEPYVLAGDVSAGENRGRGGWTWYTGSAAWLYDAVLTALLGFEKRGDRVRLTPCPRPDAEEFTLVYRFGSASYHLTAARDCLFPTLDGEKLQNGWAPLQSDGKTHEARFPLRSM